MTMKRKSLAELQQEDEITHKPAELQKSKNTEIINNKSYKIITKSEFVKMSITVEPEIFDAIEELSRVCRRSKEPFTFSAIVRDALKEYLAKPEIKGKTAGNLQKSSSR